MSDSDDDIPPRLAPQNDENANVPPRKFAEAKRGRSVKPKRTDSYESYSYNDIVKFIKLIEEREAIWNPRNDDYYRTDFKMHKFAEVEEMCSKFMSNQARSLGKCAHERWVELSKDYANHLMRIKKAASGSGTADVNSSFKYADYMSFICIAKKAREPKDSFCFGAEDQTINALNTPKRKLEKIDYGTPKIPKKRDSIDDMIAEMGKTREVLVNYLKSPSENSACKSDRICEVYRSVSEGLNRNEQLELEAKVVSIMYSFKGKSTSTQPRLQNHGNRFDDDYSGFDATFSSASRQYQSDFDFG